MFGFQLPLKISVGAIYMETRWLYCNLILVINIKPAFYLDPISE